MRKIRLSDTDLELFDIEISPSDFNFYQKHKDAFRTMWKEQGKPFWTRYVITFRSFTVKHGVIKQMNIDSPKFENLIDQAFIFIHEQFVDGKEKMAKNFIEDIARLAQNQDKFPALDSKSFARDPFYLRETRELFRSFFGMPDQKSSYLKVYILCPVFMRFGGSICRCLEKWLVAPIQDDPNDDSYWVHPQPQVKEKSEHSITQGIVMCEKCIEDCGDKFFNEKILGRPGGPLFLDCWKLGDPRFKDQNNPLFAPHMDPLSDWRNTLTVESFREFLFYAKAKYGGREDRCDTCFELRKEDVLRRTIECEQHMTKGEERQLDLTQLPEFQVLKEKLKQLDVDDFKGFDFEHCTEETAIDLSKKLLNLAKDRVPSGSPGVEQLKEIEAELTAKKAKKRKRKKANKAQAQKEEKSQTKEGSPSPEKNSDGGSEEGESSVGAYKVVRDEKKGTVSVTVTTSKDDKGLKNGLRKAMVGLPEGVSLTHDLIRDQIPGLPKLFEFWEGMGCLIAVINYQEEEKEECDIPTNFTIKVSGVNVKLHENIIVKLLFYVQKRKKRKCLGWIMDADDVLACIMPDDDPGLAGLEVNIFRGCYFKAKLSKKERSTLKQSLPNKKVLMRLDPKIAAELREAPNGKERLMEIIGKVCKTESKKERLFRCNDLWDKLWNNPDKFNIIVTVMSHRVDELCRAGLKPLDISYDEFMDIQCPTITLCRLCCRSKPHCNCKGNPEHVLFNPKASDNSMRFITGDQFNIIGLNNDGFSKEKVESNDGKSGNNGGKAGNDDGNSETDGGKSSNTDGKSGNSNRKSGNSIPEQELEFMRFKLNELRLQNAMGPHDPITGLSKKLSYQMPPPQNAVPVPEMTRTINFCINSKDKQENVSIKLEAFMPDDKTKTAATEFNANDVFKEINDALEEERTLNIDKFWGSLKQEELRKEQKKDPLYCDKHRPVNNTPPKHVDNVPGKPINNLDSKSARNAQAKPVNNIKAKGDNNFPPKHLFDGLSDKVTTVFAKDVTAVSSNIIENDIGPDEEGMSNLQPEELPSLYESLTNVPEMRRRQVLRWLGLDYEGWVQYNKQKEAGLITCPPVRVKKSNGHRLLTKGAGKALNPIIVKAEEEKPSLRLCGNCGEEEPRRKAFKKCQKCKDEGVKKVKYYCGRDCQVEDWKKRHKMEHKDGLLA